MNQWTYYGGAPWVLRARQFGSKVYHFFDWRFLIVFTAMILALALMFSITTSARQRDEAIELLSSKDRVAAADRKDAAAERKHILNQLDDIQAKYDASVQINSEFVVWLRSQGYAVPDKYILKENVRPETSSERAARQRREVQQNQERKRSGGGTNNSGPDSSGNSGSNGGGSSSGSSKDHGGGNDKSGKSGSGKSGEKSHGQNAGGNGRGQGQ